LAHFFETSWEQTDGDTLMTLDPIGDRTCQLIMAAMTTDICLVFPTIGAVEAGYEVQAVMDPSSSRCQINEDVSRRRMERAGVPLTVTRTMTAELIGNWGSPAGQKIMPFLPAARPDDARGVKVKR
jgi:hypothetical protein